MNDWERMSVGNLYEKWDAAVAEENCNLCINSLYYMHSVADFYEYKDHEVK